MVPEYAQRLRDAVAHATPLLLALDADASARPLATGKWSPREIVGHLIDSAANNHQRFVRGQLQDDLVFLGYAQEDWVRVQHYADAPWPDLVALWRLYNLHLARVMDLTPAVLQGLNAKIQTFAFERERIQQPAATPAAK